MEKKKLTLWERICGVIFRAWGWTVDGEIPKDRNAVILVAPHTSILDFVVPYLFYKSYGQTPHAMVKAEFFKGPLGAVLRAMGAVPLDRKNPAGPIKNIIGRMRDSDEVFHLAIAPEGTRKPVKRWKSGYHLIARSLGCPVYLGYMNWKTHHISVGNAFPLTDDPRKDTEMIQQEYKRIGAVGFHPDRVEY